MAVDEGALPQAPPARRPEDGPPGAGVWSTIERPPPKAMPRPPTKHLPILNLAGCYDTIKGFIKTPCQSTAKADVKLIMKRFISGGRGASVSGGEHGAPTKKIVALTSALSECIFGNVCAGKS